MCQIPRRFGLVIFLTFNIKLKIKIKILTFASQIILTIYVKIFRLGDFAIGDCSFGLAIVYWPLGTGHWGIGLFLVQNNYILDLCFIF
jgi:hypothetical protein